MALSEEERLKRIEGKLDSIDSELKKMNENLYSTNVSLRERIDNVDARLKTLEVTVSDMKENERKQSWGRRDTMYALAIIASYIGIVLAIVFR